MKTPYLKLATAFGLVLGALGCSGGGGGGSEATFAGNLVAVSADQQIAAPALPAPLSPVEVCVENSSACTTVAADGSFVLTADVAGDISLLFFGQDFTARILVDDVPPGGSVVLSDIRCSVVTGRCEAQNVQISDPEVQFAGGRIDCEGQQRIVRRSLVEVLIDGGGGDCIRVSGGCEVLIQAPAVQLGDCRSCIRSEGGGRVEIAASSGDIECSASEAGIDARGTSRVELVNTSNPFSGGDVSIFSADEHAIEASGNSAVEVEATGFCTFGGDDGEIQAQGAATVDTSGCAQFESHS